eukprot:Opistho-1_new@77071
MAAEESTAPSASPAPPSGADGAKPQPSAWSSLGLSLGDAFKYALRFYKQEHDNIDQVLHYEDKLELFAFRKQAISGPYAADKMPELGFFDFIGKDRKQAWQNLGSMSTEDAQRQFCDSLERHVTEFAPWLKQQLEAQRQREEEERRAKRAEEERIERERRAEEERRRREEEERRQREAAERQRQEQLKQQQSAQLQPHAPGQRPTTPVPTPSNATPAQQGTPAPASPALSERSSHGPNGTADGRPVLTVERFIETVKGDPERVLTIGRGETMTVRVPTPYDDCTITWEFATVDYDIAFGVTFEGPEGAVLGEAAEQARVTEGAQGRVLSVPILPCLRVESHSSVISGSHTSHKRGVYLLKFDNAYSMMRSKTVYYRVFSRAAPRPLPKASA